MCAVLSTQNPVLCIQVWANGGQAQVFITPGPDFVYHPPAKMPLVWAPNGMVTEVKACFA